MNAQEIRHAAQTLQEALNQLDQSNVGTARRELVVLLADMRRHLARKEEEAKW